MGTLPILLKSKTNFTAIGIFSLSAYPYSIKLLWSPIVDSLWSPFFGRRKSWILPAQTLSGIVLLILSKSVDDLLNIDPLPIEYITGIFFLLILLAATQDIAVDAWGLDLFEHEERYLASLSQTVGMNLGYFISHTVFLSLNSVHFCNAYLRREPLANPIIELGTYLQFWGIVYLLLTMLLLFKTEEKPLSQIGNPDLSIKQVYAELWDIIKLDSSYS
jgi:hypothetical protein